MKIRMDFVTNSSSSCYICDICGNSESGWDLSLDETDMLECENGHTFCIDEMLALPDRKELIKLALKSGLPDDMTEGEFMESDYTDDEIWEDFCLEDGHYEIPSCICPICQFEAYKESDLVRFLKKEYPTDEKQLLVKIQKKSPKRKVIYPGDFVEHICKENNLNPLDIVASWKQRFKTYESFASYIR